MPHPDPARFCVIRPGFLTTVQDLGRFGFQRFGMPVAGAMDSVALRFANRLVGNSDDAAALEMTVKGADLVFESDGVIALTGADLSPLIDRTPAPLWTTVEIRRGSTLSFGERRSGARAYLAVAGGIDVPMVLGSRATHLASRTGGFLGRALVKNDRVTCGPRRSEAAMMVGRMIPIAARPPYSSGPTLRVVLGAQADCFSGEAVETLVRGRYTVSQHADRMGYHLQGPLLVHAGTPDIVSDATPQGSLQVPGNQQPILLMADRQTTGGYPKIGVVITADLPLAAQLVPGDTVGFALVDVGEAQAIAREQRSRIEAVSKW
jgi:antagonist of KipI